MHGTDDAVVSYRLGKKLYDQASSPKEFWEVPGGRHTDGLWKENPKYRELMLQEIKKVAPK